MTDTIELRPCPFCGGDANEDPESQHMPDCYFDVLARLKAAPKSDLSLAPAVVRAWNRRAQPASVPDEVRRDAERYRWLRDEALNIAGFAPAAVVTDGCIIQQCLDGRDLDEEIDAAMSHTPDN